jgi:hypothetical protein
MTTPPGTVIPQVTPVPGSRLEQLLDMRESAQAALAEAKQRLDAIDAGIKAETARAAPGQAVIDIPGGPRRGPLRMRYHPGAWYVPAETLRTKYQPVWDELRLQKRGYWQLHQADGGGQ